MELNDENYYQGGPERVLELLRATFGDYFKGYFNGLADDIPTSYLPCVMVGVDVGDISASSTAHDKITETMVVVVCVNKKDHVGPQGTTDLADLHLRRLVMGIDPDTRQYLEQSIMGVLRTNFTLGDGAVDNQMSVEFSPSERGDKVFTQECYITLSRTYQVIVPVRS